MRIFLLSLVACLAVTGCVASEDTDTTTDPTEDPAVTSVPGELDVDPSSVFSPDATPYLSCHPGEVGDTRWMGTACCNISPPSKRQYLYRCDGRNWQKTVQTRCIAGTCAM